MKLTEVNCLYKLIDYATNSHTKLSLVTISDNPYEINYILKHKGNLIGFICANGEAYFKKVSKNCLYPDTTIKVIKQLQKYFQKLNPILFNGIIEDLLDDFILDNYDLGAFSFYE